MAFSFLLKVTPLLGFALQVLGQNSNQTFSWKFKEDSLLTKLPACSQLRLVVFPNPKNVTAGSFSGVPPYYMMAFPEGGQPITTLVGENNDTIAWTPTHPVGTRLILQIVDATGNTGGTSGTIFEIVENPSVKGCFAPPPPQDFNITSNVTQDGRLETCQPWRLNINGGTPPYRIVLDAKNSAVITNITIPGGYDAVVFVNRADPGTVLFASVHDATGRWANGTPFVPTIGSASVDCIGLGTLTTTKKELDEADAARSAANPRRRVSIIVGIIILPGLFLLLIGAITSYLCMRIKSTAGDKEM